MERVHINLPVNQYADLLSWEQATVDRLMTRVYEAAMALGCRLEDADDNLLRDVEARGGTVDWNRRAVVPTRAQLDEVCDRLRTNVPAAPRADPVRCPERPTGYVPGNGANLFFDWDAWTVRPPTAADLEWVSRWAAGYDKAEGMSAPFMLKDMNILLEPMFAYALMCHSCPGKRVHHAQPTEPVHVKFLDRMSDIVRDRHGYKQPMANFEFVNPPFRFGARGVRTMLARIDMGVCDCMGIGPMTVSGMSAPVTVVGTAVVAVAEVLAALHLLHVLRPAAKLMLSMCTGELDLATGRVKYFGLRTHLQNLAGAELCRRGLGVASPFLTWYRDANEPGLQACYEFGFNQAFFSGLYRRCHTEIGGLGNGNIFSPEQAVMDMEIALEYDNLLAGFDAGDDMVGLEEILNAGYEQGHHLSSDHTLEHMRDHIAWSDFFFRGYAAGLDHDRHCTQTRKLMNNARQIALDAHRKGCEMEPDNTLGNALWEVVCEAAAELNVETPPRPW